jgi:signal transduction histidine kinase
VATLRAETDRLARLVTDLLLLARADEHGGATRRDEVDLDELVDAERIRARETSSEVVVHAETTPVRVLGDRDQLAMVIRNLVDNAVRHAGSAVLIRLRRDDRRAALEVIDDGPGVPAADRQRIFDRFVRLDDSRARAKGGAGLGLAIVAEVVRSHGGDVTVGDAAGGGARFTVHLPAHQVTAPPPSVSSSSSSHNR